MGRVRIRPTGVAEETTDGALLVVTYDVVAEQEGGYPTRLATEQSAPVRIDQQLRGEFLALFAKLGQLMEHAAGITVGDEPERPESTEDTDVSDDEEL